MPVCIGGMHRSGTSMVAKLLHECGLYLGAERDLMPAQPDNPDGFWENLKIGEVNDDLLNEVGAGWDCPPALTVDWVSPALLPLRRKAQVLAEEFRERESWGWKDPRSSFTFPFWRDVFGELTAVLVIRNPLEVAASLKLRNFFSYALSLNLWKVYNERFLEATASSRRLVTHYDAYFDQSRDELGRLLSFLQFDTPENDPARAAGPAAALRHNRFTWQQLLDAEISSEVINLYLRLCAEADWLDDGATHRVPDALVSATVPLVLGEPVKRKGRNRAAATAGVAQEDPEMAESRTSAREIGRLNRWAVELELLRREVGNLRGAIAERDAQIMTLQTSVPTYEAAQREMIEFRDMVSALQERVVAPAELERRLSELSAAKESAEAAAEDLTRQVGELQRTVEETVAETQRQMDEARREADEVRQAAEREAAELGEQVAELTRQLASQAMAAEELAARVEVVTRHEHDLQDMLLDAHQQLLHVDGDAPLAVNGTAFAGRDE